MNGRGEREAIALAVETHARRVILDDLPARRLAASLGLPVIGTAGLLLAAKNAGLIAAVAPPPVYDAGRMLGSWRTRRQLRGLRR